VQCTVSKNSFKGSFSCHRVCRGVEVGCLRRVRQEKRRGCKERRKQERKVADGKRRGETKAEKRGRCKGHTELGRPFSSRYLFWKLRFAKHFK
jgi:hypothetical protein